MKQLDIDIINKIDNGSLRNMEITFTHNLSKQFTVVFYKATENLNNTAKTVINGDLK